MQKNFKDITGLKFNKLTAIRCIGVSNHGKRIWECQCECGKFKDVIYSNLVNNRSKSCGICVKSDNLVGQKFGNLTVLEDAGLEPTSSGKNQRMWLCIDDRGFTKKIRTAELTSNRRTSLCVPKGEEAAFWVHYSSYKLGAENRNLPFELTYEQFKKLTIKNCIYCNQEPSRKITKVDLKLNGIDRIDNSKGYTLSNSASCCKQCNFAKGNMKIIDWIEFLERIQKTNLKALREAIARAKNEDGGELY